MAKFLDGPASGVSLELRRAPIVLRVVHSSTGNWDALDQETDQAEADERVYLYMIVPNTLVNAHVQRRGVKDGVRQRCGWFQDADYRFLEPQPNEAEIRSNEAWLKWCEENCERIYQLYLNIKEAKEQENVNK